MQLRNLSPDAQRSYLHQISQLARYFGKAPDKLSPSDIRSYQLHLIQKKEWLRVRYWSQSQQSDFFTTDVPPDQIPFFCSL
ncbi:MAG: phage integrase N-terminal SAM-like domain-containing protein [Roseiarcus sp.]